MVCMAVNALDHVKFCPWCGKPMTEVLTSAPPKCAQCRRPLGVMAWCATEEAMRVRAECRKLRDEIESEEAPKEHRNG